MSNSDIWGTDPEWLYRRNDPPTSRAAAYGVDSVVAEQFYYDKVFEYGREGTISDELMRLYSHVFSENTISPRRHALIEKRLITAGPDTRPTRTGRQAQVVRAACFATPEQKAYSWKLPVELFYQCWPWEKLQ